jgi:predicted component of viral defense system (DUF524 family)
MAEWPIADGVLLFCIGEHIKDLPEGLPSDLRWTTPFLYEWIEYWLEAEALEVYFGAEMAHPVRSGLFRYTYCNQIGQSTIRLRMADGRMIREDVEVISQKLKIDPKYKDDPLFYPTFYRRLVNSLVECQRTLPFTFVAPTYHIVEETMEPPSFLFLFHFLRDAQVREKLRQAVEGILVRPHRLLMAEEEFVPLPQVCEVDADVVLSILTNPQHWVEYQGTGLSVAQRLDGYAPQKVWQRLTVETFDTPENRFVKWFVRELQSWVEKLLAWTQCPEKARHEFVELKGQLELALHDPLFDEVGEMVYFPATSQVLLKRSGYRELLELYRQYLNSKRPAFFRDLQEAIDSRDVATLYEYWCFFDLVKRLEAMLGKAKLQLAVRGAGDLKWGVKANFGDTGYTLIYNRHFAHKKGSYSVPLRPDFALMKGDQARVVFDAKFRFEIKSLAEKGTEEDEYDMDVASGDVKRVVKHADLYKMHTYKDALGIALAVVLYPGTEERFYWEDKEEEKEAGVGAIPLVPEG